MTAASPHHVPVLLPEVLTTLAPIDGSILVDGTFGAGEYSRALLEAGARRVIALDRDPTAIAAGRALEAEFPGQLTLVEQRFGLLDQAVADTGNPGVVDGVVLDIGVSSMQLDRSERGFSFRQDGPLDMRMSASGISAADVVNGLPEQDIARLIYILGEDRYSRRIAKAIVARRTERPFRTTRDLAEGVEKAVPKTHGRRIHPATQTFQALRIFVNDELGELFAALGAAERVLAEGGRLVVVTFHSLEDRIVKRFFADRSRHSDGGSRHGPYRNVPTPTFRLMRRKAVVPSDAETIANPRARSAKLRSGVRLSAPARAMDARELGLPLLNISLSQGHRKHDAHAEYRSDIADDRRCGDGLRHEIRGRRSGPNP